MKIRRFFAPDMRRAIQLVRQEHGADAVILSSRAIDGGMEIVSAVDYDEALVAEMLHSAGRQEAAVAATQAPPAAPAPAEDGELGDAGTASLGIEAGRRESSTPAFAKKRFGRSGSKRGAAVKPKAPQEPKFSAPAAAEGSVRAARVAAPQAPAAAEAVPRGRTEDSGANPSHARRAAKAAAHLSPARNAADASARLSPARNVADASAHLSPALSVANPAAHSSLALRTPNMSAGSPPAPTAAEIAAGARGQFRSPAEARASETPQASGTAELRAWDPALVVIRKELDAMKCMLREQFEQLSWADLQRTDPDRALLAGRVAQLGLEPALADTLVAEVEHPESDEAWREVMLGLARRLPVPKRDPLERGGVFALVGPTGVGKTTTVAKLAARHCLRYGKDSLALISTDTVRVGAQRQLDVYGAILGAPVRLAGDATELGRLLYTLRDRRLVLIDTAGMAPRDRRLGESLSQLEVGRPIRKLVVLAANMQAGAMNEAIAAFGGAALAGAVLTKLDEAEGLGDALSVLIRERLKTVWLSHGQRVPEDLCLAKPLHLLRWALSQPEPKPASRPQGHYPLEAPKALEARNAMKVSYAGA